MGRAELPAIAFLAIIAASLLSLTFSLGYLGRTAYALASADRDDSGRRQLAFVAPPEPLPSGSINAIAPLPGRTVLPAEVAATAEVRAASPAAETPVATGGAQVIEAAATEQAVASSPPAADSSASASQRQVMVVSSVNVRDRPSNNSRVIATVRGGTRLAVTGEQQGWVRVSGDGRNGWIYRRFLRPVN